MEKKKKKIKNLTNEEVDKICSNYECCENCPLYVRFFRLCKVINYYNNFKKELKQEIEVEE